MTGKVTCLKIGQSWQVTIRDNCYWSVGDFRADLHDAVRSAEAKFEADHPQLFKSATDLSDLLV